MRCMFESLINALTGEAVLSVSSVMSWALALPLYQHCVCTEEEIEKCLLGSEIINFKEG